MRERREWRAIPRFLMTRMGRMELPLTEMKKTMDGRGLGMGADRSQGQLMLLKGGGCFSDI